MTTDEGTIDGEDIAWLNRRAVAHAGVLARLVGTGLMVIGAIAAIGWVWISFRQQQELGGVSFGSELGERDGASLVDRVDAFVATLGFLVYAGLVFGGGVGLRLVADYTTSRTGGSLSGWEVGDVIGETDPTDDPAGE